MLMREENVRSGIDGICASCKTSQKIPLRDAWYLDSLYKVGDCPSCNYEHVIFVRKA